MDYRCNKKLKQIKDPKRLYDYACYWLNRYPCSTLKLKERLLKKCSDEKMIDDVILRLKEINYLDDKKLASGLISSYLKRGYGRNRINRKLYEKRILDKDIVKSAWEENKCDAETEREKILELIQKKLNHYNLKEAKGKRALIGFLLRRGFDYEDIADALRKVRVIDLNNS
ncbi:MAG: hypothetical protein A2042_03720 [Candidatus Schekmanbacteria bacterium GWA2_38_11]|uniref:Regulatory protein RecX n=1 Tax=Candidatus Schekmanbacteria bacterium GWA2_38_11 TaxID=1817876 RepID=A0A1F7RJ77_9BACT|nr:MAG: hypothetical protein A2042_03720 [Candidatus Schekmanbacteria bacterium GWA2_38_11]